MRAGLWLFQCVHLAGRDQHADGAVYPVAGWIVVSGGVGVFVRVFADGVTGRFDGFVSAFWLPEGNAVGVERTDVVRCVADFVGVVRTCAGRGWLAGACDGSVRVFLLFAASDRAGGFRSVDYGAADAGKMWALLRGGPIRGIRGRRVHVGRVCAVF